MLGSDRQFCSPASALMGQAACALSSLSPIAAHGWCPVPPEAIRRKVELEWGTEDDEYLGKVERSLERALQEHRPDVLVYNAGTDILEGDRLGGLAISPQVGPGPGCSAGAAGQRADLQQGLWTPGPSLLTASPISRRAS